MKIDEKISNRLNELIASGEELLKDASSPDHGARTQWGISSVSILKQVFSEQSPHYEVFHILFKRGLDSSSIKRCIGILRAAKDDYDNGYIFDTKVLIEAEVFDEFLEQAEELFGKGYYQPAAVVTGCVLEDGLRKLCLRNNVALQQNPTIDPMNAELAKVGIYNKLTQKKITTLADLRNKAAHGQWDQFNEKDVEEMIRDVRRFMEEYFS